jgi:hypothetical protein
VQSSRPFNLGSPRLQNIARPGFGHNGKMLSLVDRTAGGSKRITGSGNDY